MAFGYGSSHCLRTSCILLLRKKASLFSCIWILKYQLFLDLNPSNFQNGTYVTGSLVLKPLDTD
jgi:hypothetical protein